MYKIVITKPAVRDLANAAHYIKDELKNVAAAIDFVDNIQAAVSSLSEMPRRNPLIQDKNLSAHGFRLITVKNYLVFYIIREATKTVVVERILFGRRDWKSLL